MNKTMKQYKGKVLKAMMMLLAMSFALVGTSTLSSCSSDDDPFFTVSEDDDPRILNTDLADKTLDRKTKLNLEIKVTPVHYTTVTWLLDGTQIAEGTTIDQPLPLGNHELKIVAYGIGNKVNGLITLPSNAIGSATATIVGQNMGAKQSDRAEKGYRFSMWISVVFLFIGGMILSRDMISTAIVRIFSKDAEVVGMAADFLSVMAFWCFTNGIYNTTSGLFQGTGHTEVTMAIDVTRLWVFRFLTLWFCESVLHMGVRSVWYSVVISNGISSLILYVLYRCGIWKKTRIKVGK